jgi:tetratricopeptide (TPR) repeat protein
MIVMPLPCLGGINNGQALVKEVTPEEMNEISRLIEEGKANDALERLSLIKINRPQWAFYELLTARALIKLGRLTQAMEHLQLSISYGEGRIKEEALFERARLYLYMKFYPEAATAFRLFLNLFPDSTLKEEAYLGLAEALRKKGQYEEALRYYEKTGSIAGLYGKANTLHLLGRYEEANRLYVELILRKPDFIKSSHETSFFIGENMMILKKKAEARRYLGAVKDIPYRYRAYLLLGKMEMEDGHLDEALKYLDLSLQSEEPSIRQKAYLMSGEIFLKLGRYEEAKKRLLELRNLYPFGESYERSLLLLSKIYKKEGKLREANNTLRSLIFGRRPSPTLATSEAMGLLKELILEASEKESRTFLELWKENKQLFLEDSNIPFLFKIADILSVLSNSRESGVNPQEATLTFAINELSFLSKWLFKNSSREYKRKASFLMAELYLLRGEADMGLGILQGIRPEDDKELRLYAELFLMKGEYERAFEYLLRVKELKKEDRRLLMKIALHRGDKSSIDLLERFINKHGVDASFCIILADLLYKNGRYAPALSYYKKALSDELKKELNERELQWATYRVSAIEDKNKNSRSLEVVLKEDEARLRILERSLR